MVPDFVGFDATLIVGSASGAMLAFASARSQRKLGAQLYRKTGQDTRRDARRFTAHSRKKVDEQNRCEKLKFPDPS